MLSLFLFVVICISITYASGPEIDECNNYHECEGQVLNNTFINCYGYQACRNGTIISGDPNLGYIDCPAADGCRNSVIAGKGPVYCTGASSCQDTPSITGRSVTCSGFNSCVHPQKPKNYSSPHHPTHSLIIADSNCTCSGSGSCQNSIIISDETVECTAQKGCRGTTIQSGNDILCEGEESCEHSTLEAVNDVTCLSKQSCRGSSITARSVLGHGFQSVFGATVFGASLIEGFGAYSFSRAVIESENVAVLSAKMYGHLAGLDGLMICRSGSECNIECAHNGCKGLTLACLEGSTCNLEPKGCNGTFPNKRAEKKNRIDGVNCPVLVTTLEPENSTDSAMQTLRKDLQRNQADDDDEEYDEEEAAELQDALEPDAVINPDDLIPDEFADDYYYRMLNNSNMTEGEPGTVVCDKYHQCQGSMIHANFTKCYAYESCLECMTKADLISASDVECYGADSCHHSMLVGIRKVECNAKWGCRGVEEIVTQITKGDIRCNAEESCVDIAGPMVSVYVECNGAHSCPDDTIHSFMDTQCNGYRSCYTSDILSDSGAIACIGRESCKEADAKADDILCSGYGSCSHAKLIANRIRIYGGLGAEYGYIYAAKVYAYGYQSLWMTEIDSFGQEELKIKLFGHYAGYGATIICRAGSSCSLTCKSTGCHGTTLMCVGGAKCSVKPEGCTPLHISDNPAIRDVDCPVWKKVDMMELKPHTLDALEEMQDLEFFADENRLLLQTQIKAGSQYTTSMMVSMIFLGFLAMSACIYGIYYYYVYHVHEAKEYIWMG